MRNEQKVKHLFWRAGFGLTPEQWMMNKNRNISDLISELFQDVSSSKNRSIGKVDKKEMLLLRQRNQSGSVDKKKEILNKNKKKNTDIRSNWLNRMSDPSESVLLEKMTLFWHGHFACITRDANLVQQQLSTLRKHALGNFREFLLAISKDAAMMKFLNTNQNRKKQPNENYARELLELFSLGIGHYTEKDIQAAARAFTGWSFDDNGRFIFYKRFHDNGQKTFLGKTGNFDGNDIIDIILEKKRTATFIATKVYKYFVNEEPDNNNISELANVLYNNNYDIKLMMRTLFESDWFYDKKNIGTKIKSPIELIVGLTKTLEIEFIPVQNLLFLQKFLGQELFAPPSVKGWDGGRNWINNSTILFRINLVNYLLNEKKTLVEIKKLPETRKVEKNINRFRKMKVGFSRVSKTFSKFSSPDTLEKNLSNYLIVPDSSIKKSKQKKSNYSTEDIKNLTKKLVSSLEYQLC